MRSSSRSSTPEGFLPRGHLLVFVAAVCVALLQGAIGALLLVEASLTESGDGSSIATLVLAIAVVTGVAAVLGFALPAGRTGSDTCLLLITAAQIAACVIVLAWMREQWSESRAFGIDAVLIAAAGVILGLCALLAVAAALCLRGPGLRIVGLVAAVPFAVVAALITEAAIAAAVTGRDCDRFAFASARWSQPAARERMAPTIIGCGTLEGHTRAQVRRRLGPPDAEPGQEAWAVPHADSMSSDADALVVRYGADGRVREVTTWRRERRAD